MPVSPRVEDPLILSFSPRGEGTPELSAHLGERSVASSLSQPHPLADAATLKGKLAKASLMGEGWGEGGFAKHRPGKRQ